MRVGRTKGGERRKCRSGGRVRVGRTKGGERRKCRSWGSEGW